MTKTDLLLEELEALINSHKQSKKNPNAAFLDYRDLMALAGRLKEAKEERKAGR